MSTGPERRMAQQCLTNAGDMTTFPMEREARTITRQAFLYHLDGIFLRLTLACPDCSGQKVLTEVDARISHISMSCFECHN
jgi:hypothetical protein